MKWTTKDILQTITILVVAFVLVVLSAWFSKKETIVQIPENVLPPKIQCLNNVDSFINTEKKLLLIEDKPSNGANGILKGYKITIKRTGLTDNITCGYLMYEVSFDGKKIEQDNMALYMRPTNGQFGGHIWRDENRGAIISEPNNFKTQVIMPLDTITYDDTVKQPIKQVNWASLLNVSDQIEFEVALSADVLNGNIDLIQFAYKCVNKDTGRENDACLLEIIKTEPFGF